jgi:hypothetical protein
MVLFPLSSSLEYVLERPRSAIQAKPVINACTLALGRTRNLLVRTVDGMVMLTSTVQ